MKAICAAQFAMRKVYVLAAVYLFLPAGQAMAAAVIPPGLPGGTNPTLGAVQPIFSGPPPIDVGGGPVGGGGAGGGPLAGAATSATFNDIAFNITKSIEYFPGLVTSLSYLSALLLTVVGVMKIKEHVENPERIPLKDSAIRLAAGGALFALPMIFEAAYTAIGTGTPVAAATLYKVAFNVT